MTTQTETRKQYHTSQLEIKTFHHKSLFAILFFIACNYSVIFHRKVHHFKRLNHAGKSISLHCFILALRLTTGPVT